MPEGVFSYLPGTTNELGAALVADPRVKAVGFTGSRGGGLALVRIASERAEHRNRPERNVAAAQIGAGQRSAVGLGRVDGDVEPSAFAHDRGEQAELADRASALTLQPRARQPAFAHRAFDQRIADGGDFFGDGFKEQRARFGRGFAEDRKSPVRQRGGIGDVGGPGFVEVRADIPSGCRIDRGEARLADAVRGSHKDGACNFHDALQ